MAPFKARLCLQKKILKRQKGKFHWNFICVLYAAARVLNHCKVTTPYITVRWFTYEYKYVGSPLLGFIRFYLSASIYFQFQLRRCWLFMITFVCFEGSQFWGIEHYLSTAGYIQCWNLKPKLIYFSLLQSLSIVVWGRDTASAADAS